MPAFEELQAQRPGPEGMDDDRAQQIVSRGHDAPGTVMSISMPSLPFKLIGNVAPVEGGASIALHRS